MRFGYTPEKPLMNDVTICVEPGWKVAIVGPTGAGKTTLVNLLMRFYEIDCGKAIKNVGEYTGPLSALSRTKIEKAANNEMRTELLKEYFR